MFEQGIIIPILTFISVICLGGAVLSGGISYRQALRQRLADKATREARANQEESQVTGSLAKIGQYFTGKDSDSSGLRKELARSGHHGRSAAAVYLGAKAVLFVLGFVVLGLIALSVEMATMSKFLMVVGGASALFFIPNFVLRFRRQARTDVVRNHLPDAIDILEICVSGGMGIDSAWNSVAEQIRPVCPILADEMALTNLEIHLGGERAEAMRHMSERTGADEMNSLVAVLVQSERFGTSVGEALRVFTTNLRDIRSQKAEEQAEKMAVKMLFPMITMIFPVVLIVAVGPAGITLSQVFGTM